MSRFQCRLGKKGKLVKLVFSVLDHNMPYTIIARGISEQASFSGFELLSGAVKKIGGSEDEEDGCEWLVPKITMNASFMYV